MRRPLGSRVAIPFSLWIAAGCASYPGNAEIERYDLEQGYRFKALQQNRDGRQNSDELFVVLAFSGGGTRAAALSYGVLAALDQVRFRFDPVRGIPCSSTCPANADTRTLLDEVDVISSVSGGSFAAAYYALHGRAILEEASAFKSGFLYYPAQRDLLGKLAFRPRNWWYLGSRVEIAANQWQSIFGEATFADLQTGARPYLILNSTDVLTGGRFEFSQEQFDLFCGELSTFPLRRAVAASSAFPGLLTPMTLDSHWSDSCGYVEPTWFDHAIADTVPNYQLFRRAREMESYQDADRRYVHVMDGGVADNLGLRAILRSLEQEQVPNVEVQGSDTPIEGGWSLRTMINRGAANRATGGVLFPDYPAINNIVVIVVNARTNTSKSWGASPRPPGALAAINVSAGIPIGRLSWESMDLLRQFPFDAGMNTETTAGFFGFEVAFENIQNDDEREFFVNLGTNFQLSRFEVDCLVDRGGALLREASSLTETESRSFGAFVEEVLQGDTTPARRGADCTTASADQVRDDPMHLINVGLSYSFAMGSHSSARMEERLGLSLRIARPSGWGALFSIGPRTFDVTADVAGVEASLGDFELWATTVGVGYTVRHGRFDITPGATIGYGFGGFDVEEGLRRRVGRDLGVLDFTVDAPGSLIGQAEVHAWLNLTEKLALTGFAQYMYAEPHLGIFGERSVFDGDLVAKGLRLGVGAGFRVY